MKAISKNREYLLNELTTLSAKVKAKGEIDNASVRKQYIERMSSTWILRLWWRIFNKARKIEIEYINSNDYFDHYTWEIDLMIKKLKIKMLDEFIVADHELISIRKAIKYIQP